MLAHIKSITQFCTWYLLHVDVCVISSQFDFFWGLYFQVRVKAVCVLESILRNKDDDNFSRIATYFAENNDLVLRCSESPQASLKEKANKVHYFNFSLISFFTYINSYSFFKKNYFSCFDFNPIELWLVKTGILVVGISINVCRGLKL